MEKKTVPWVGMLLVLLCASSAFSATITYDQAENALWVRDFPQEAPATLDALLGADRKNNWGLVSYDQATDTYRVNASLHIGSDQGASTFFQIGRKDHPKETVIVKGDVWIKPPKQTLKRPDGRYVIVNRLTLGDPNDSSIKANLKIDCETNGQYSVFLGLDTKEKKIAGGDLHVYNSTITAATQDKDHMMRGCGDYQGMWTSWFGSDIRLINATVSWYNTTTTYSMQGHNSTIEGTTFEHGGGVLDNGQEFARNCTFRNLRIAVAEGGCLDATLVGCKFQDNEYNWTLGSLCSQGITMIDCEVGPQKQPVYLSRNKVTPLQAVKRKVPIYPCYTELQSLVVKVTDAQGKPIYRAAVSVLCREDPTAVKRGFCLTSGQGLTPSDPEKDAILITKRKLQATDDPENPKEFSFTYTVSVEAPGYKESAITLRHDQTIPRPLAIALQK